MRMLQSGWTRWIMAPNVALMIPPPIRTTSMGLLTPQSYGARAARPSPARKSVSISRQMSSPGRLRLARGRRPFAPEPLDDAGDRGRRDDEPDQRPDADPDEN